MGLAAITVVAGGLLSAALVRYAPGFGTDERQLDARLSSESIAAIRAETAKDAENVVSYYATALRKAASGDLGVSRTSQRPVREVLRERFAVTSRLVAAGLLMAWAVAFFVMLGSWLLRSRALEFASTLGSGLLLCLPAGAIALLLVLVSGPGYLGLALVVFPKVHRYIGNLVQATSGMPHIINARAKGVSELAVLLRHVIPLVQWELLALAGVSVGLAISAAIPIEALCGIPGIGQLAWQSALARDLPVLLNVSVLVIACTVLANSGADLLVQGEGHPA